MDEREEKEKFLEEKQEILQKILDDNSPEMDEAHMYEVEIQDRDGDPRSWGPKHNEKKVMTLREYLFIQNTSIDDMDISDLTRFPSEECTKLGNQIAPEDLTDEDKAKIQDKQETVNQLKETMEEFKDSNPKGKISYYFHNRGTVKLKGRELQKQLLGNTKLGFEPNIIDRTLNKIEEKRERKQMGMREGETLEQFQDRTQYENRKRKYEQRILQDRDQFQDMVDKTFEDNDPSLDVPAYYNVLMQDYENARDGLPPRKARKILTPRQLNYANNTKLENTLDFEDIKASRFESCQGIGDKIPQEELSQDEIENLEKYAEKIKAIKESKDFKKKGRMYKSREFMEGIRSKSYKTSTKITKGQYELLGLNKNELEFKENKISLENIQKRIDEIKLERSAR